MKPLRIIILILLALLCIYIGREVYLLVFSLLDFQVGVYKVFLQTGEHMGGVKDAVGGVVNQALGLFGDAADMGSEVTEKEYRDMSAKIMGFERKLKLISGVIGVFVGYLAWKILSDIVFSMKVQIQKVREFLA